MLLDSHLLIWLSAASDRLPDIVRQTVENTNNELFFSAASIWELSIKESTGRARIELPPALLHRKLLANDFKELPVTAAHGLGILSLPAIHKDPFDRILIAQAIAEDMVLMTSDETIAQYEGPTQLAR